MSTTSFLTGICLVVSPFILLSQTNRFVNPSGADSGDCSIYGSPCQSINYAISQSANGDTIYLSDGTFSSATLNERLTIRGNGPSTVVQGITIDAAVNGTDRVTISDLTVSSGGATGVSVSTSYVTLEGINASGHTSRNVSLDASGDFTNIRLENCTLDGGGSNGLYIGNDTGVDGLTVLNTTHDNNTFGIYFANASGASPPSTVRRVQNVVFRNCTFSNNLRKGIYVEKLESALLENISVISSGTDATYGFNNGIDINLKWQAYSDITIRNSRVTGSGAIGSNDIGTAPENRRSSAIAIKARTDAATYDAPNPLASLTNVTLDGVIVDGLVTDLRFGEMGKTDNNGIDMSTVTISHCSIVNDNLAGLLNEENTNTLTISNNYWGGGAPSGTDIEDYGTSSATSQSSELANVIVDESDNSYTSLALALAGMAASGTIQNIPAGTESGTTTISQSVTLATPGAGLLDASNSLTTFQDLVVSSGTLTLGSDFAASTSVTLSSDVVLGDYNFDGVGVAVNSGASIQDGIDMAAAGETVTVGAGTYAESLSIQDGLTLDGGAIAILEPPSPATAIDIDADNVTIDGFQIGTDASTSNATIGINSFRNDNITIQNNTIFANTIGILSSISETGTLLIDNNDIQMLALQDAISGTGSVGIYLHYAVGSTDADITNNDISNAVSGIFAFGLTSSTEAVIDGGNYTGCTTGILPINSDGTGFSASNLTVQNLTMSGFATDVAVSDTETGVYAITVGGSVLDDITIVMDNLDISGVNNDLSNYSGIVVADFPTASDGAGVDATIQNCNIHDNANRGIYTRGEDAVTNITQSSITGNGFDPTATGGNPGFSVIAREGSTISISNCFITNPAALTGAENIPSNYYVSGLQVHTGASVTVSECSFDNNGNGFITEATGLDLSGNYFGTTDEATIVSIVGASNDFTPWLSSGADSDLGTAGYQPDYSGVYVGPSGVQTAGDRLQEGHDLLDADGTMNVIQSDWAETLTVSKNVILDPEALTTIDDLTLDGGNLTVLSGLEINNTLTLTNGIFDIDLDDGDKSDDPVLIINNPISGAFDDANHIEGKVQVDIGALGSFSFPVGDADSYRPVDLSPVNAVTFQVSHIEEPTPTGVGVIGSVEDLVGETSSVLGGLIESVMDFRYWTIDAIGVPGVTSITLQLAGEDEVSDPSSLGMTRFDGLEWVELSLLGSSGSDPYTVSATTAAFSDFTIYSNDVDANPLPVELIDFRGDLVEGDAHLSWSTLSEINSDYFQIERLTDSEGEFESIGSINSSGDSNERLDYSFIDKNLRLGSVAIYRLKMVDFDGSFEYSKSVVLAPKWSKGAVDVYPNPTSNILKFKGLDPLLIKDISIYGLNGNLEKRATNTEITNGQLAMSELGSGYHLLMIELVQGDVLSISFVKR